MGIKVGNEKLGKKARNDVRCAQNMTMENAIEMRRKMA
jgi:hypothetical protein